MSKHEDIFSYSSITDDSSPLRIAKQHALDALNDSNKMTGSLHMPVILNIVTRHLNDTASKASSLNLSIPPNYFLLLVLTTYNVLFHTRDDR